MMIVIIMIIIREKIIISPGRGDIAYIRTHKPRRPGFLILILNRDKMREVRS